MDTEPLTDPRRIGEVLDRLRLHKQLLGAHIPNHKGVFNSLILAVDSDSHTFLLDELVPSIANSYLAGERRLIIRTTFNGVEIRWDCKFVSEGIDDGASYFQFQFPEQMDYRERRQSYRVQLPRGRDLPVVLKLDTERVYEGRVADISFGGIGIELDHADVATAIEDGDFRPGVEISDVEICFEDEEQPLQFGVEVRHTRAKDVGVGLRRRKVVHCSAQFRDLQQSVAGRLRGFIQAQQRQLISGRRER